MKKKNKSKIFASLALGVLCIGVVLSVVGLSSTVSEIKDVSVSKTPSAILASAGVREGKLVSLPVAYYDQRADDCVNLYDTSLNDALYKRQFEWSGCGYHNKVIEQGLVAFELDDKYMPVAIGGRLTSNRGVKDLTRWFSTTTGESESYSGNLKMQYVENGTKFVFEANTLV